MNNTPTPLRSKKLVFVLVLFVCQLTDFVLDFDLVFCSVLFCLLFVCCLSIDCQLTAFVVSFVCF